jgi:hypothetical protein
MQASPARPIALTFSRANDSDAGPFGASCTGVVPADGQSIPRPDHRGSARLLPAAVALGLCLGSALFSPSNLSAAEGEITAVSSNVSEDYVRTKLPDGSFEPEAYAFGEGGLWSYSRDPTIEKLHFLDVARTIAGPLAAQKYVPTRATGQTKLLIMVYWGTTAGTADSGASAVATQNLSASQTVVPPTVTSLPNGRAIVANGAGGDVRKSAQTVDENMVFMVAASNRLRDKSDFQNARLLGYDSALSDARGLESTALRFRQRDLLDEIEENRYFVVLMAYDFQLLLKDKKHKLLWETRFSIREHRNDFSKELSAMAQNASRYFGQDSHGVIRKPLLEGHVELGEIKVIETEPDKK